MVKRPVFEEILKGGAGAHVRQTGEAIDATEIPFIERLPFKDAHNRIYGIKLNFLIRSKVEFHFKSDPRIFLIPSTNTLKLLDLVLSSFRNAPIALEPDIF